MQTPNKDMYEMKENIHIGNKVKKQIKPKEIINKDNEDKSPSISEFWSDGEFIEFLKNVAWFWTEEDTESAVDKLGPFKILYQNLSGLREEFNKYKEIKKLNLKLNYESEEENPEKE